jgi:hypothetical protein
MRIVVTTFMSRILKVAVCLLGLATTVGKVSAFSGWAAAEGWQTTDLDYVDRRTFYGEFERGATKNFGEFGRLNVPILTYAFDEAFLQYYGAKGEQAVDSAIATLNALPPASSIDLSRYLTQGNQQINYSAQALGLFDLKSAVMGALLEHMGLIGETHDYDLRFRYAPASTIACYFEYAVINRNFDPQTFDPTPYVNGTLYSYQIVDGCPIGKNVGDAFEQPADTSQSATQYTAVATKEAIMPGGFFLNLTRDDVGGIRYLYRKNNYEVEALDPEAAAGGISSSSGGWQIVVTTNLGATTPSTGTGNGTGTVATNLPGIYGGVEKITYVKVHYQSLFGSNMIPVTYNYTMPYVTNGILAQVGITRTVTQPDIIFSAGDLISNTAPPSFNAYILNPLGGYVVDGTLQTSAGGNVVSSVFTPRYQITFNSVGPFDLNLGSVESGFSYLDQNNGFYPVFWWGSFDGSTNAPVLFPTGSSISALESQILSGPGSGSGQILGSWNPVNLVNTNAASGGGGTGAGGGG